ncbi:hypothetical protein [Sporomusa sp. KB1]|jgi:hypothetical protein|uniref:hypothetical protein n=1 Tax=Sporomusa sp. KB1 TaxID=943346 RepID=UPI00119D71F8|nr:hypothetical protein [Sporomusa sp. KB1]TWH49422.1 hypothetical protein Salpa_5651 [Sporomusa sp. KB1]
MKLICKITLLLLAVLHLIKPFITIDISQALFVTALAVLLTGLTMMGKGFVKATLAFLVLGTAMLVYFAQPMQIWIAGVNSMTNVIAILVVMQTFSMPIRIGEYNEAIRYWLNKTFKGEGALFLFTMAATHLFTSFLMFGAIPVMVSLMGHTLKNSVENYKQFIAVAITRGYALTSLWAPGAINLFLVIQATGISWSAVFWPGVVLSIIGMGIAYFLELNGNLSSKTSQSAAADETVTISHKQEGQKALHIILVVSSLISLTMFFDKLHVGAAYNRIILAGFVVISVWMVSFIRNPNTGAVISSYWQEGVLKTADLAPFFIAIGIFSTALEHSSFMPIIQTGLQQLAAWLGIASIAMIPLLIIVTAVLGLHPFVTLVMFGKILTLLALPVTSLTVALCLAVGGSISYMVSPFAGLVMTTAKLINVRPRDIAITWNWHFCLIYFVVGLVFAYYWGQFAG